MLVSDHLAENVAVLGEKHDTADAFTELIVTALKS